MNIKIKNYEHCENGISLQIVPETDAEEQLLKGIFKHGKLETGHPCKEFGNTGFYISCYNNKDSE